MKTTFMRGGLLGLAMLAAGGIAVSVAAPAAEAAPAYTYVYGVYTGATADASGCSQVGGIGYSRGWWTDWTCYETQVDPHNASNDQWTLVVTD